MTVIIIQLASAFDHLKAFMEIRRENSKNSLKVLDLDSQLDLTLCFLSSDEIHRGGSWSATSCSPLRNKWIPRGTTTPPPASGNSRYLSHHHDWSDRPAVRPRNYVCYISNILWNMFLSFFVHCSRFKMSLRTITVRTPEEFRRERQDDNVQLSLTSCRFFVLIFQFSKNYF